MNNFLPLVIYFLSATFFCSAQAPTIQWSKCYGGTDDDEAYSVLQVSDGGYVVAGLSYSNDSDVTGNNSITGLEDIWLIKLDSLGNIEWQKCLGGFSGEGAMSIKQTTDSGFIIVGYTSSNDGDVTGGGYHNSDDWWVIKTDYSANIQWQKCYGGSWIDHEAYDVVQTPDNGYLIVGETSSNDGDVTNFHGERDYWVIKIDSAGTLQWERALGGTLDDVPYSLLLNNNSYIIVGTSISYDYDVTGNIGNYDGWIVKLDQNGITRDKKNFGGTQSDGLNCSAEINNSLYFCGGTNSNDVNVSGNHGGGDIWLVKMDTSLNLIWQKCLGGYGTEGPYQMQATSDSGFIISGISDSYDSLIQCNHGLIDGLVFKIDSLGNNQWSLCLGGSYVDELHSIKQTRDGGYIAAGFTESDDGDITGHHGSVDDPSGRDFWVVKLAPIGLQIPETNWLSDFSTFLDQSNKLHINFYAGNGERTQLQLLDITGRIILQQPLIITVGYNNQEVDMGELATGVYVIRLFNEERIVTKKLMKD